MPLFLSPILRSKPWLSTFISSTTTSSRVFEIEVKIRFQKNPTPSFQDVHSRGDAAVVDYTAKFDKVKLDKIVEQVVDLPDPELDRAVRKTFDVAYDNIRAFHMAQKNAERTVENMKGVRCKRVTRCIGSVGIYVPGGTTVLPSTTLILSVPAQIAGCKTVILATPPSADGGICKEVLYCAKNVGETHILKAGGA